MMALVEAARKVRAITARTCTHGQIGSQCGRRERLWPSSLDASLGWTSRASRTGGVISSSPLLPLSS